MKSHRIRQRCRRESFMKHGIRIYVMIGMTVLFLFAFGYLGKRVAVLTGNNKVQYGKSKYYVVLDAGHGGIDPGKVGINGALEKDINLLITLKLKEFLEAEDVKVILTRDTDQGLYKENDSNKKVKDMKKRVSILNDNKPNLAISIHQNSFPQGSASGAQVFYYKESIPGKIAAQIMQQQLIDGIDNNNHRQAKENSSYYLLKKTTSPLIIVECGFLSNYEEAQKLLDKMYQEKMAWNMHLAIMQYLNQEKLK